MSTQEVEFEAIFGLIGGSQDRPNPAAGSLPAYHAEIRNQPLTTSQTGLALDYHLRSNSRSNGRIAKECHRFLVAGPFNFALSPGSGNRNSLSGVLPNQSFV